MNRSPVIHSASYCNRDNLSTTGFISLDDGFLNSLINEKKSGVYTFCLTNRLTGDKVYAGVRDFAADQGVIVAPWWMMEKLKVTEGSNVDIESVDLPKATRVVLQPISDDFLKLSKPRIVLERALMDYPCLTQGTVIPIEFAGEQYYLKVLKTEPLPQVDIRHTDVDTDFAPPVTQFAHNWNTPDTDSSDEDVPITIGHRLNGKDEIIKERHSTMASREKDLKSQRYSVGVRKFVEGQEILPPPPPVKKKAKKQEYVGTWHNLKNESGVSAPKVRDNGEQFIKEEEEKAKKESLFKGTPRKVGRANK